MCMTRREWSCNDMRDIWHACHLGMAAFCIGGIWYVIAFILII
jgi:hypothetical protein